MSRYNKRKFTTLKIIVLCVLFFTIMPINSYAQDSQLAKAPIIVDGKPVETKYVLRDGHLLVPPLFFKHTGTNVNWNDQYQSIVFYVKNKMFALHVGKKFTDDYSPTSGTWERGTLSTEMIRFQDKLFVPLVDVAKKLGMIVKYDPEKRQTMITTNYDVKENEIYERESSEKLVALSFDDGPDYHYTPKILDILKEKGVPATFFVMGKHVKDYPGLTKRMVNEGHSLGNHTYTHPYLLNEWSGNVRSEIQKTQEVIEKTVGSKTDLFRPPYGAISKADKAYLNKVGLRNIIWSVDTLDYSGASAEQILETVNGEITPGGIILQHNFQEGRLLDGTVKALPKIIDDLHEKGYKFVTVQTLLEKTK